MGRSVAPAAVQPPQHYPTPSSPVGLERRGAQRHRRWPQFQTAVAVAGAAVLSRFRRRCHRRRRPRALPQKARLGLLRAPQRSTPTAPAAAAKAAAAAAHACHPQRGAARWQPTRRRRRLRAPRPHLDRPRPRLHSAPLRARAREPAAPVPQGARSGLQFGGRRQLPPLRRPLPRLRPVTTLPPPRQPPPAASATDLPHAWASEPHRGAVARALREPRSGLGRARASARASARAEQRQERGREETEPEA